ncbi:HEAT repeat domain-containing protein [Coleofasciculus sp. LEGE 07081]|uniref:NACHT domain-containing protein n=1 Tax=Coleofasciculus sp. LEGE 07081 TaxID=2777967 RepID=UPI0018806AE9|nr:HEAT repeat domain-containing protein [Coleofasciculus sp. LEGE 07081]MBE9129361.1 HEAT repeat domain-containing protein [Coleofasciculus sp. LEGE 07081]
MEPVTMIIGGWLGELATVKVAEALLTGVGSKLNPNDLERALKAAIKAAQEQHQALFFRCEPDFVPKFLEHFFKGVGLEELQKPLNNQGMPQVDYLVAAFKQAANDDSRMQGKIEESLVKSWMEVFVRTYFERTNEYLRFQVAKADYFEQLANWFDDVKFAGIAVPGQEIEQSERLAQIFVMPDVVEDGRTRSGSGLEPEFLLERTGNRQTELLWEQRTRSQFENFSGRRFNARQLLSQSQSKKVVLLGAPGSGKTTLMSYFAVMLAQNTPPTPLSKGGEKNVNVLGLDGKTDWLPILIKIRDLARQPDSSILDYTKQFAEKSLSVKALPEGFFEYWLADGRALILLDGLDEVAEESKRYEVVQRIENFLGQYSQNRAIITSRPAGYKRDFFKTEEFPHYELQPFDDDKIEEFINRWYDSRVADKEEAKRRKESLRKALSDNDRIKLLARNPLLLTIIALIHRYQAVLPKERYKLYDKAVETLLTSWDANKELTNHTVLTYLGLDDLRRLMETLAYWIHTQGSTGDKEGGTLIDRDELISQLGREIRTLKQIQLYEAKEEAKRFIEFIRDRTGLLNEQGTDCYAFVHKTFQEYLCAEEINYQADNEGDFDIILEPIKEHLHDPHWREVLLLLIAQQKPKKAVKAIRAILNNNSEYEQWLHRDLLWAGTLLTENIKDLKVADSRLPQEIVERLVELEISDEAWVGRKVRQQVYDIFCHLHETDFEAQALELLKAQAETIGEGRLLKYQAALGEQEAVVETLLLRLEDENSDVRFNAVYALGKLGQGSETIVNALLLHLEDEDSGVRREAADALGKLGQTSETVVNALLLRLEDENSDVRVNAAYALGLLRQGSETIVNALLLHLDDEDSVMRDFAARALGRLGQGSETVVNALLLRLEDEDSGVRSYAAFALGKLGQTSETVVNALLLRLEDEDADVRGSAASALGKLGQGSETVVNALLLRLDDQDSGVRWEAAHALGELGQDSETVVNALLLCLEDENSGVRGNAAFALGKLGQGSETVVNALLLHLDDEYSYVRVHAAIALGKLGKKSSDILPAIVQWLEQHQDSDYVGSGIDALWDLVGNG